jgi:hypothetical protein
MAAVTILNFEILNDGQELAIDVETIIGSNITSIKLWDIDTFKDESLSIDLDYKLEQINNKEVFIVTATELNISSFTDIWFIEIKSDYEGDEGCVNCQDPALGITYNLQPYYKCMLNYLLESEKSVDCNSTNVFFNNKTITVNLLIDSIEKALNIGYYLQAIEMLNNLKKLCDISKCKNCQTVVCSSCSNFIQQ